MADTAQAQAQNTLKDSHTVAAAAAKMHGDALSKIHAQIMSLNAQGGPAQDPSQGAGQGGQDQDQQGVWNTFPSTDPQQLQQMAQQAGDPQTLLAQWAQGSEQDREKFDQLQLQNLMSILGGMAQPSGAPDQQQAPPPGVGGELGS